MISSINNISLKKILWASLFLHLWASYFSTGFQHFDEHFQIIEFLNLKWGGIQESQLPWEYHDKIRPWFQTFLYYCFSSPFKLIGISNPFFYSWYFRLLTGLLGWSATVYFINLLKEWFESEELQKWGFIILNFLWFAPFVHVRTSSESLSISLYLFGTILFLTKKEVRYFFLAGLFWGFTYHARFQMALPVAFVWFYALLLEQTNIKRLVYSALGVILAIGVGTVIDYWGYGEWGFSLWHYYRTNFIEGRLAGSGHAPLWEYVRWGLLRGIPPVSLLLVGITIWGWIKMWRHPLTWMTLPLFIFHSLIGHKEVRYLFPTMVLAPLFLLFYYQQNKQMVQELWQRKGFRYFINLCFIVNFATLIIASTKAVNPSVNFYSFLWGKSEISKIYAKDESPFTMLGLDIEFYKKQGFEVSVWKDQPSLAETDRTHYIFLRKGSQYFEYIDKENCTSLFLAYPEWLLHFNVGNWLSRSRVWSLFECRR